MNIYDIIYSKIICALVKKVEVFEAVVEILWHFCRDLWIRLKLCFWIVIKKLLRRLELFLVTFFRDLLSVLSFCFAIMRYLL